MKLLLCLVFVLHGFHFNFSNSASPTDSSRIKAKPVENPSVKRKNPLNGLTGSWAAPADTLNPKLFDQEGDTTLVMAKDFPMPVDENSFFENELYKKRLDSLQREVPLTYNEYVQSYINLYVYKRRSLIERLLGEGTYYFPIFEKALRQEGVPVELKYLPIIESALNPFAISRVGATGPWQFMYGTGKDYGLNINSNLDERRDPFRSSEAAAHYLKDMYGRYGNWLLVIASYNCGKGNVDKAIRRAHGAKDFWAIQRYLPKETRTYVPAFIAATYAMNYAWHHGLHSQIPGFNTKPDSLFITQTVSLSSVASNLCLNEEELKRLNPKYKKGLVEGTIDNPYCILLPDGNLNQIPNLLSSIKSNPEGFLYVSNLFDSKEGRGSFFNRLIHHKVRHGETLSTIADRYSCEVKDIKAWNHLHSSILRPGQKLKLEQKVASNGRKVHYAGKRLIHYKVRRGDTLESIAMRFNISVGHIKNLNRLHSNLVKAGQNLKINNRI